MSYYTYLFLIFLGGILSSCIDKNATNIEEDIYFTPEYSFPIGETELVLDEIIDEWGGILTPIDTTGLPDTTPVFIFNELSFESPFEFDYSIVQSFDFSSISEELDKVTSLMIRANCVNEIPGGSIIQVFFLDAGLQVIDSLYKDGRFTINAATVDDEGYFLQSSELWKFDTYLSSGEVNKLQEVKNIRIDATLNIENLLGKEIYFFSGQKFWFQLGLRVGLEIPLNEI